ncbi:phospholipase, patatin family protein [Trichophaea hybrida]|nr:phospholipase, patatin family protein [Trichophaea hybrida]
MYSITPGNQYRRPLTVGASVSRQPRRLLCLDGGGVRGLSSIRVLQHIMNDVNENRDDDLKPCEVFDMIGGTGIGGIIAIMLGRLRMTVDECETAYLKLSKTIFTPRRQNGNVAGQVKGFLSADGKFDSKILEDAILEEIKAKSPVGTSPEDILLKDENQNCKVLVAARQNNAEPAILRSYRNPKAPELLYGECKVWEACRATSAVTTFFDPITIGNFGPTFVDGAIQDNNPVQLVHREAMDIWPGEETLLISIGTGSAPGRPFQGHIATHVEAMKRIVTQSEHTAKDFYYSYKSMVDRSLYFRFNVTQGLAEVGLEEWRETGTIQTLQKPF